MSDDVVSRARAALQGVTRGPWRWTDHRVPDLEGRAGEPGVYEYDSTILEADHHGECGCRSACQLDLWINDIDARFIAESRTLVPDLVSALEAARAEVARLRSYKSLAAAMVCDDPIHAYADEAH